jgi:hypothetical protein
MMAIKSVPQSASSADASCIAPIGQDIMSRFPEAWHEDVDPCDRRWVCHRCQGFIRHQRSRPGRWALRPASFSPGFRGLSERFIDFEALIAAAAGSRHCPDRHPSRDWIRRLGGWLAIVVRAGRLRSGRTGHPAAGRAVPRSVGRGHPQKPQWCAEA